MNIPTMDGITAKTIKSTRLSTRVLFSGEEDGQPVLFLHGNASNATYWEETMLALPTGFRGIAPDQRGYGGAEKGVTINARRGMGDLADDALALLDALGIDEAHVVGHSMGGSVIWRLMLDAPARLISVTLVNPGSPFGFGGTKDADGTPYYDDYAASGGGIVNPNFAKAISEGDRGSDAQHSPRVVMNNFYWKPPFKPAREEELLSALLSEHIGEDAYPGDSVPSANWPGSAPGVYGPANALSPKYGGDVSKLYAIDPKPAVLWIRGADDQIVSDQSLFDLGTLGMLGAIPGYPGVSVAPPQPMVSQTRAVLEKYHAAGGVTREVVIEDAGHTPYLEKPNEFNYALHQQLTPVGG